MVSYRLLGIKETIKIPTATGDVTIENTIYYDDYQTIGELSIPMKAEITNQFVQGSQLSNTISSIWSITETAYGVGFQSPAYFSNVFKETYRQTPTE